MRVRVRVRVGARVTAPWLSAWSLDGIGPGCVPMHIDSDLYFPVFVWELVGTFVLCMTVLATAVAKPGHGDMAPLAIGLAISINVGTSGSITGGCYNPARFFGPALVYGCRLHLIWLYFFAEILGGLAAAAWHKSVASQRAATDTVTLSSRDGATEMAGV